MSSSMSSSSFRGRLDSSSCPSSSPSFDMTETSSLASGERQQQRGLSTSVWKTSGLERIFPNESDRELFSDASLPKVLFCGLPRCGKTSICKVVFNKMSPHETLCLVSSTFAQIQKVENTRLARFCLVDFPLASVLLMNDSQCDEAVFEMCTSLVFVIDAQTDRYSTEVYFARDLFRRAFKVNPEIHLELFIHKMDGDLFASDEVRMSCQRDIHDKLLSHLHEEGVPQNVIFYSTSVYDHTVFEACSRVVQRLVPQVPQLEDMLDLLVTNCRMERAFLIDVVSKTFIATDSAPFDPFNYELCTDMIEVVIEMTCMYGYPKEEVNVNLLNHSSSSGSTSSRRPARAHSNKTPSPLPSFDAQDGVHATSSRMNTGTKTQSPLEQQPHRDTPAAPTSALLSSPPSASSTALVEQTDDGSSSSSRSRAQPLADAAKDDGTSTMCLIQLNSGHILYMKAVDRLVVLACVMREENFDKQYLIDYNIRVFRSAVMQMFGKLANRAPPFQQHSPTTQPNNTAQQHRQVVDTCPSL